MGGDGVVIESVKYIIQWNVATRHNAVTVFDANILDAEQSNRAKEWIEFPIKLKRKCCAAQLIQTSTAAAWLYKSVYCWTQIQFESNVSRKSVATFSVCYFNISRSNLLVSLVESPIRCSSRMSFMSAYGNGDAGNASKVQSAPFTRTICTLTQSSTR